MIVSEITLGKFDYQSSFPESKKPKSFDTTIERATYGELSEAWFKSREVELTANTLRKTASQLRTLISIVGEQTPLTSMRHSDILKYRSELLFGQTRYDTAKRSNKMGRSVRTVDNYTSLFNSLLRFAYRSGFINDMPFEGVKKLQKSRPKPDPLIKVEFSKLMSTLSGQPNNLWQFAVYSGIRHGELAALAWEDIDLEAGTVKVQRNLNALGHFGPPKTLAGNRTITLLKPALAALKAQRKITAFFPKAKITFYHREYGLTETQNLHFVFMPRAAKGVQKPYYSLSSIGA